jgi:hypothetical protein
VADINKSVRIEFKGEGSGDVVAQYDAIIRKQKDLEVQLGDMGPVGSKAAQGVKELDQSLEGYNRTGGIAAGISKGLALGLGALGNIAAQAVIEGVSWAIDKFNQSATEGQAALDKYAGKAEMMATALLQVESAAGLAMTKVSEYNRLLAQDEQTKAAARVQKQAVDLAAGGLLKTGEIAKANRDGGFHVGFAGVLRDAANNPDPTVEEIKAWLSRLESAGRTAGDEGRKSIQEFRVELLKLLQATQATTPAVVTLTDVQLKQRERLDEAAAAAKRSADENAVLAARTAEFNRSMQELLPVTGMSVERATELANANADVAALNKTLEIQENNLAEARKKGTKATEDSAAAAERAARAEQKHAESIERMVTASRGWYGALGKARDAMREASDEIAERQGDYDAYVASIRTETELLGLSNEEREIRLALMEAERTQKRALTPAEVIEVTDAATARNRAEIAKKEAEEVERVWTRAAEGVNDAWSDFLFDVFDKGKFKFGDFAKSLKATWARALADMIAMSTQQSIVAPLFKSLFGMDMPGAAGGAGSVFGGAAGTVDIFSKIFGGGGASASTQGSAAWMQQNVYGPAGGFEGGTAAGSALGAAGPVLGGAMMGFGVGKIAGSATGGAIGGAIGSIGGPIGSLAGSIIGGLIGGLFKSTPKSISSYGTGGILDSVAGGGLDVKIGKDMANGVIRALTTFADQLATGLESDEFLGMVGQRGKKFFYQAQQSDIKSAGKSKYGAVKFEEAEDAIAYAIEAAINSGVVKGLTDSDKKLMRAATSVEQAMQDVVASHDFKRELGFQFAGLTSPLAEAQARLEYEYQEQLKLAEKYEADKTQLEAVYAAKRVALVQQYADEQNAALEQSLGGLKDYLVSITGGAASPLSPTTRLSLAQSRYADISKRAKAGDQDAIDALQGASQDYLDASRSVYGSAGGYQSTYQNVVSTLSSVTGVSNPLGVSAAANQNTVAAMNDNTRVQAAYAERAISQRNEQSDLLKSIDAKLSVMASTAQRGSASPTQNGVVGVGTVDWAAVTQAIAGLR